MLTDKKREKLEKILGKEKIQELEAVTSSELKNTIVNSECTMKSAQDELDANEKYQELLVAKEALSAGLSEVKKRQNAVIQYCAHLLEESAENSHE